jgi:streptogramin lyase
MPSGLAFAKDGSLLICDNRNNRIRRIDFRTGVIETFAVTGDALPDARFSRNF